LIAELELADGVGFELRVATIGEGEGRACWKGECGVRDGCGGVVREIEVACGAESAEELGAEVNDWGGEAEGCGLPVAGE
jgi:hypothetical protein